MKAGKITLPNGLIPEKHELLTVSVFTNLGFDVVFIAPSRSKGSKSPDIKMAGVAWELKSPQGSGSRTLDVTIKRALKQSSNIIIDLRRTKLKDENCERLLKTNKNIIKGVKRLKIVTKRHKVIDIIKQSDKIDGT